ncbi:hypothetical protein DFH06DRAFT_1158209 [Mycena polygramma]|nr:hypothetical protein DFH06DRAFT_1158209 [Mycena polygramma]
MKLIISITLAVTAAFFTAASPLGGRRSLSFEHQGAPLARRFILSSRFDVPAACEAKPTPAGDVGNVTAIPNLSNSTVSDTIPDNSTLTVPTALNSTISLDNSTLQDTQPDGIVAAPTDNSTDAADTTPTKRYSTYDFVDAWFDLCSNSGGNVFEDSDPCFDYGIDGFSALFADADVCAQQETADAMITFAKSEGVTNSADLIQFAVSYRRMPRESVQLFGFYPSTPYCGVRPFNTELNGVWNEQPEGVTVNLFGGPKYPIVPFGQDGSCPYGQFPDVTSCSCVSSFFGGQISATGAAVTADSIPTNVPEGTNSTEATATDLSDAPAETAAAIPSDPASSTNDSASSASTAPAVLNLPSGR